MLLAIVASQKVQRVHKRQRHVWRTLSRFISKKVALSNQVYIIISLDISWLTCIRVWHQ